MGKNRGDKLPTNTIFPEIILSPLELRVAQLQRSGLGRNGISAALEISENTVKTLLSRIAGKLGANWMHNSVIKWREVHINDMMEERDNPLAKELQTWPSPLDEQMAVRVYKNRVFSNSMLIAQSNKQSQVLKVSGAQRFWIKPALTALTDWRYIKLRGVDWYDEFGPPWLPIVNKGRRVIRAAGYEVNQPHKVTSVLQNYIRYDLRDYIMVVFGQIETVRQIARHKKQKGVYPTWEDLSASVGEEFGVKITDINLEKG